MFALTDKPVDTQGLQQAMRNDQAGACAEFEGWVRNHNAGRQVDSLEYEAFDALALHEGEQIVTEARQRFNVFDVRCVHRVGHLAIGDVAVWVGVTAKHRDQAFQACRYVIDQVKSRVPVWKKEHYTGGEAEWVNCTACAAHATDDAEARFYERQSRVPEVGEAGQDRLKSKRVLVVGAGGLGCPALSYLAAAGVGCIGVCDDDRVEVSNLHRQVMFTVADAGRLKAEVAAERLAAQNPFITVKPHAVRLDETVAERIVKAYDLVLDCTDNFRTKFLLHDACFLAGIPLVHAAIYRFDGQLQVFRPGAEAGCLRCVWPEVPEEGCVGTCADVGVLGVVPGVLGAMQAAEAIKILLGLPGVADQTTLLVDLVANRVEHIRRVRDPACPLCGDTPTIRSLAPFDSVHAGTQPWEIDVASIQADGFAEFEVIDIRQSHEREHASAWISALRNLPSDDIDAFRRLDPRKKYLLACHAGIRSHYLVRLLRAEGLAQFFSLRQGIDELALRAGA